MPALHDIVKKGSTDRSVVVSIIDSSDGTPETGVVYNTSGIDLWYRREGAAKVSITEATLASLTTSHTDGGFLHISDGEYRLDLPDAAFASGANYVDYGGTVTGMVVIGGRVRLVDYDLEDSVRLGITALPNAAADAAGGLPISDAGGLDLDSIKSAVDALPSQSDITGGAFSLDTDANGRVRIVDGTGAGELDTSSGLIAGIAGTITTLDALDTAQDTQHGTTQSAISGLNDLSTSDIDARLAAIHLDHLFATDYDPSSKPGTATALLNELVENDGGVSRFTVNALENGPSGSGASAESIADAVWDEAASGHTTAGTFGKYVADILEDSGELQTNQGNWLTATGFSTHSAADVADAVWDEDQADHTTAGSFGELATEIASILSGVSALPSQSDITGGAYSLDTDANGRVRIVDGTGAGELDTNSGLIAGIAGTITTLDALDTAQDTQHGTTQSAISGLNDFDPTAQITESYAANGVAPTYDQCWMAIHQFLMQFVISGTSYTVKQLDNSTTAFTGTLDDASSPTSLVRT